uniref:Ubiquitin-conjugating enzyme E2 27 n=1 Tax=Nicotiana tabacum TaxID=4097 RepID=A0A1S3ZGN5_TOBAC|nr:PREDICTED: ubiquitin-conjugating enzyme E2 27-like [Nicotiana tabacum]
MVDLARVQKELQECNRDVGVSGISVTLKGDSLTHLIGTIPGPLGTPYEGGSFKIDITLTGSGPYVWGKYGKGSTVIVNIST